MLSIQVAAHIFPLARIKREDIWRTYPSTAPVPVRDLVPVPGRLFPDICTYSCSYSCAYPINPHVCSPHLCGPRGHKLGKSLLLICPVTPVTAFIPWVPKLLAWGLWSCIVLLINLLLLIYLHFFAFLGESTDERSWGERTCRGPLNKYWTCYPFELGGNKGLSALGESVRFLLFLNSPFIW